MSFVVKKGMRINHEDREEHEEENKKIIDLEICQRMYSWVAGKACAVSICGSVFLDLVAAIGCAKSPW